MIDELMIVEYKNIRVLTTEQIARVYETDTKIISNNFNRNKERYKEGKHYICLSGQELKEYKTNHHFDESSKINKLYLWTEKGAFLHAKSLNTDVAWEVYDRLVDSYFNKPSTPIPELSPQLQILINMELKQKEQERKLAELEEKAEKQTEAIQTVKDTLTESTEDFQQWAKKCIAKIAYSSNFTVRNYRYQEAWTESYKRLTNKAGCNLDVLVRHAKERASVSGATKTQIKAITKVSVISANKRLKEIYIAVLREMMIAYCVDIA